MANYKYYQPNKNDVKDEYGDCVIRALTKALNKTWVEVFDELVPIAREIQCNPNSQLCYTKYLKDNGFVKGTIRVEKGLARKTTKKFATEHQKGTYILRLAHHLVTVVDGVWYDTWDSGNKAVYTYWTKGV